MKRVGSPAVAASAATVAAEMMVRASRGAAGTEGGIGVREAFRWCWCWC